MTYGIKLGDRVHYVTDTPMGAYALPARVIALQGNEATLRVYTDITESEWLVTASYSAAKLSGTYHLLTDDEIEKGHCV